jgi:hypothetical protein
MTDRHQVQIDDGMMYCAISNVEESVGVPESTGFLNRRTGEIVFLHQAEGETDAMWGTDAAVDAVFDRAGIDASPADWVEIPKYDSRVEGRDNEDAFIRRFLALHGIEWS